MVKNSSYSADGSSLDLGNSQVAGDLKILMNRIRSVDKKSAVRLMAEGNVLAVYGCTLAPETLLDSTSTVLGMRAFPLAQQAYLDVVVENSAMLDRLARIEEENYILKIPPVILQAPWAGINPPRTGWSEVSSLSAQVLTQAATDGMKAVEDALPENPGQSVVQTVRSRIWGSTLELSALDTPTPQRTNLPLATAFTAVVLGFIPPEYDGDIRQFTNGQWSRLNAPGGFVLVRNARQN